MNYKTYTISRYNGQHRDVNWNSVKCAEIDCMPWEEFDTFFTSVAQAVCFDDGLSVRLSTKEPNPLSTCTNLNDMVCNDSCLEFFVQPYINDDEYFNFEFNPSGVMYLALGTCRSDRKRLWPEDYMSLFEVQTRILDESWSVNFFIPFDFIKQYIYGFSSTASITMSGNFYKCGDKTPSPHYLSWNNVGTDSPDFHRPEFFGNLTVL